MDQENERGRLILSLLKLLMPATLITNIKCLVNTRQENKPDSYRVLRGKELSVLPVIENAYLIIENGVIAEIW
jgi:hypothetical protein